MSRGLKNLPHKNDLPNHDPEYIDLLRRVLAIQADCEIGGPHLYVDAMLPAAPSQIDQLVVARTAAEEIDHFRKFARLAGDLLITKHADAAQHQGQQQQHHGAIDDGAFQGHRPTPPHA